MKVLITDNDSTLMEQEILDEIALCAGDEIMNKVSSVTDAQMNGDVNLSFEESLKKRVDIVLSGKPIADHVLVEVAKNQMSFSPGVEECLQAIIEETGSVKGQFFIFSGGFCEVIFLKIAELNIPEQEKEILKNQTHANCFAWNNGVVTGVDFEKSVMWKENAKLHMTQNLLKSGEIQPGATIIGLGDGSNDVGMVPEKNGYCVAYTGVVRRENTVKMAGGKVANDFFEVLKIIQ